MGIATLVLLTHLSQGVVVPSIPNFKAGHSTKGEFTLTVHNGSNPNTVMPGKLVLLEKSLEANGSRVYALTLSPQVGDITTFEVKTNPKGTPIEVKQVTKPEESDPMNALFIAMQRPMWPDSKSADSWITKIPNPGMPGTMIDIDCLAKVGPNKNTIILLQSSKTALVDAGSGALIESQLTIDAKSGAVKSVHEAISVVKEGKASLLLEFDSKS